MLWLKAFHIFFVVAWFAGLFYLPRLFLYHVNTTTPETADRFKIMERRLFVMMTIGAVFTTIFGVGMLMAVPGYLAAGWLHAKLTLVVVLLFYHGWCYRLMLAFRANRNAHSEKWYRAFNEVPTVILLAVVLLVVLKPF